MIFGRAHEWTPNSEHLRVLFQGVPAWNAWREANPNVQPELGGITLLFYLGKNFAYHPPGPRTRAGV
jgi:hypothetical protein